MDRDCEQWSSTRSLLEWPLQTSDRWVETGGLGSTHMMFRLGPKAEVPMRSPMPVERCQLWLENARISVDRTVPFAAHVARSNDAPSPVGPAKVVLHCPGA